MGPSGGLEADNSGEAGAVMALSASHGLETGHGEGDSVHVSLCVTGGQQAGVGRWQAQAVQHLPLCPADIHLPVAILWSFLQA